MDAPALPDGALKAVFLDAGGTLIHLDWAFLAAALREVDIVRSRAELEAAFDAARRTLTAYVLENPRTTNLERAAIVWGAMLERAGCRDGVAAKVAERVRSREDEGLLWSHVEPGTIDALETLRARGLMLGVVSNSDGRVERFLELAGLRPHLDFVVDSGRVGVEKPDPRIFEIACGRAEVGPEHAVHVGDIYHIDVVGARAAGIAGILLDAAGEFSGDDSCPTLRAFRELPERLGLPGRA